MRVTNKNYTVEGSYAEVKSQMAAIEKSAKDLLEQLLNGNYSHLINRKDYAVGMIYSAIIAKLSGYSELVCLEFGVAPGADGLKNLSLLRKLISEHLGISYEIHGFDRKEGMPPFTDYRDHPELWAAGSWGLVDSSIPDNVTIHEGDVAETVLTFSNNIGDKVIGFVAFDLDQYTGTKHALQILNLDKKNYLPIVPVYVDDLDSTVITNPWQGSQLAVNEFNTLYNNRKIDLKFQRKSMSSEVGFLHVFDHDVRTGVSNSLYPLEIGFI